MMFFTSADNLAGLNTLGKDDQVAKFAKYSALTISTPGPAEKRTPKDEEEG